MVIYAYFKAILGPFTVISYTSKGGMKYSVMPRLTQDYIQLLGVATGSSRSSHNVNFCVIFTLGPIKTRPVNKSSADFAQLLLNHLCYIQVIYLIGKP